MQTWEPFCRYSPAILLLQHFDVLSNWASSEGSQSDHTGVVSEVASVIRKFTQQVVLVEDNSLKEKLNGTSVSNSFSARGRSLFVILSMSC